MTFEAETLFGRLMDLRGVSINVSFMTFETEPRCFGLEQGVTGSGVPAMTIQAGPSGGRFMGNATNNLPLFMTLQTDRCRRFRQHAGILAGVRSMAALAIAFPHRIVL